mmetsp:Transcript_14579/g.34263  ORF Transcript_14579/g.34263 Transcript_14579/m.34263 type:complete len:224 (+) Transcript_14579:3-674(+)
MEQRAFDGLDLHWTTISREAMVAQTLGLPRAKIRRVESAVTPSRSQDDRVEFADVDEYCEQLALKVMCENVREATELVRETLFAALPAVLLDLLSPDDLAAAVAGEPEIDVEDWRNNTTVEGFASHDVPPVSWLWSFVQDASNSVRQDLLQFMTGMRFAPFGGFATVGTEMRIVRDTRGPGHLPNCATCSFQLNLPEFESPEQLAQKMNCALDMARAGGFGMA